MNREQYNKRSLEIQNHYNFDKIEKVCEARVDCLVDLCCLKTDFIFALEEEIKKLKEENKELKEEAKRRQECEDAEFWDTHCIGFSND